MVWSLSLDLAFVITQELTGIHHGVSKKKNQPDKNIFEVYRKFFLSILSNERVDGGEAVQKKRKEADLDSEKNYLLFLLHTF